MTADVSTMVVPQASEAVRRAWVGIGANVGDPLAAVQDAVRALQSLPGATRFVRSPLYRTAPIDASGPDFLNAVAAFDTSLSGRALLDGLQAIERRHGRERPYRNAPRTLDLDLLLLGDEQIREPDLTVPHPRMHLRAFVLQPLHDLAPDLLIPGRGPVADWLARAADQTIERLPP
jgi:2-amino-4-hydroxy-6-hydroxymethyldihydropteridine diphosphokinase